MGQAAAAADDVPPPAATTDSIEQLARYAITDGRARWTRLGARLEIPTRALDTVYQRLAQAPAGLVETASGAEWLLDNHYIVRRAARLLDDDFPIGFERRLPRLTEGEWRGSPRAYALAREIVRTLQSQLIDQTSAEVQVRKFQRIAVLTTAELWALPTLLRLALLEQLSCAAELILQPIEPMQRHEDAQEESLRIDNDPGEVVAQCIRSLQALETADWKAFFESLSSVEQVLRTDPAQVYAHMDFETRDRYRKAVEELAFRSPSSEEAVATAAIRLAAGGTERTAHVGFYLVDSGRPAFEQQLRYRGSLLARVRAKLRRRPTAAFLGAIALLAVAAEAALVAGLVAFGAPLAATLTALVLFLVPAMTVAVSLVNGALTRLLPPERLPKMDFDKGIPSACRTLVAVPALLTSFEEIHTLLESLEIRFLGNQDPQLQFALLSDFADAEREHMPADAAFLERARQRVEAMNARYGSHGAGPFHLLHRPRRWNAGEERWIGWERKRGKLSELNRLLLGDEDTGFTVQVGNRASLVGTRFAIVLDADTELPRDAARRLVATLAHPLNRAELDPTNKRVVAGYTVLQPRVEISYPSAESSWFARLCSGAVGFDPYVHAVSDVYQDLFGEGIFVGKGIYDVAAFERTLKGRVPESALLSHDLFEGIHGRAGLVTDAILVEDFPSHYLAYTRRLHRWARGDWQLLPWLRPRVPLEGGGSAQNRLSVISRWKIFDNLRRSLLPPVLLAFLLTAWLWLPGPPLLWTGIALLVLATPGLTDLTGRLVATAWSEALVNDVVHFLRTLRSAADRWLFEIVFLPHHAAVLCDAIARTLVRLTITRRRLLQWTPAAYAARSVGGQSAWATWREMGAAPAFSLLAGLLVWSAHPAALLTAAPLLALWLVSPLLALSLSRVPTLSPPTLRAGDIDRLRRLARETWAFFETYVTPEDQWLPPDHFQESPRGTVARRTSPTNIGLSLLATTSAYDLGYRGLLWTALRLQNTFDTLDRMERYRGHFFNWYETAHLQPLEPRYVSAVDSGNLVGAFVTIKQACLELADHSAVTPAMWPGLRDTIAVLRQVIERVAAQPNAAGLKALLGDLERMPVTLEHQPPIRWREAILDLATNHCPQLEQHLLHAVEDTPSLDAAHLSELRLWLTQVRQHVLRMQRETDLLVPWLDFLLRPPAPLRDAPDGPLAAAWDTIQLLLGEMPTLGQLPKRIAAARVSVDELERVIADDTLAAEERNEISEWAHGLLEALTAAAQTTGFLADRLRDLGQRAERFIRDTDFTLLYDRRRRLLHLGYDVGTGRLDDNHYDLLASEARLASFLAIAKGDVPQEHWLYLGRPVGNIRGRRALLSWSGTMFEYLMPGLMVREDGDTLLGRTCRSVVNEQIAYGRWRGVPWGMSEAGFYRVDAQQNYQYRAFGVPTLGFKRGLEDDVVVSPYATVLALRFQPRAVAENINRLEALGACGRYGFYESIDFTPSRLPPGDRHALVREYMAHHQGMILAALNNFLNGDTLVRRFHAEPMARTAELLLYERPALDAPVEQTRPEPREGSSAGRRQIALAPWEPPAEGGRPQVHVLGNGRYTLAMTNSGGGFSRWGNVALTRWVADVTLDDCGTRFYVRDRTDGKVWSLARGGAWAAPGRMVFHPHMIELHTQEHGISVHSRITVAPDADVEIRHVRLVNEGNRRRYLTLTSYADVVLGDHDGYRRHPAFSKLFVESEYIRSKNALIFQRRPGMAQDVAPAYLLHMLLLPNSGVRAAGYESARDAFHGRGTRHAAPALRSGVLSGTVGTVLDPIMALAADIDIAAHGARQLAFITAVAPTREAVLELADRYSSLGALDWTFQLARRHGEAEVLAVDLDPSQMPAAQYLLSLLLYPQQVRHDTALLARNEQGRSGLWRFALSGDLPILLVRVQDPQAGPLLHQLVRAQTWWRRRGVMIDLVILNEQATSYSTPTSDRILRTVTGAGVEALLQRPGGIFVIGADQLSDRDRALLFTAARVVLDADGGGLEDQLALLPAEPAALPPLVTTAVEIHADAPLQRPRDLQAETPYGGFSSDGHEYVIHLDPGARTPAPWVNVIANPGFGFLITEAGGGYTWALNSSENRLTPWSNDPVTDDAGEAVYLRDEETGEVWSSTPAPAPAAGGYRVRHGAGYTIFHHRSHGLDQELTLFVPADDPVKIVRLELTNRAPRQRRLTATYYLEWVLGPHRDPFQQFIIPEIDGDTQTLLARNPWNEDFSGVAFAAASQRLHGFTGDRTEFLGHRGRRDRPAALARIGLSNVVRPGLDPCAALQVHIDLAPGETRTVHFLLGQGRDREDALRLVRQYRDANTVATAFDGVRQDWNRRLGVVTVRTPEPDFDLMVNRWLLYQTLASRIWGRTGFYQSSGAYGFRDQLQDVAALVHGAAPALARSHLLEAAAHQFREGDVLHWWHPPAGAGIRTRCSDDLLWLPYITALYVGATGDLAILNESVPFLDGERLRPDEHERYARFGPGAESASLYVHCLRAIERGDTAGQHGLPLFGSGDWNDGMNRVGRDGIGESVWLGWFLYATLQAFAPLCRRMDDTSTGEDLVRRATALQQAIENTAWDGRWYRRGYYDDGRPLGSVERDECRIDSIAQSWSVMSGAGDPGRSRVALQALGEKLVREMDGLILLLSPPFERSPQDPGYIRAYPPGIRENGGHYSHAAAWAVWAIAASGNGDQAMQVFRMLLPTHHTRTAAMVARYRVEPYVLASDIYGMPPHTGRGGWTWYTGSSSWVYRMAIEIIIGLRPHDGTSWTVDPCIPRTWPALDVTLRDGETTFEIHVSNPDSVSRGVAQIVFDGKPLDEPRLPRVADGRTHRVEVTLGHADARSTTSFEQPAPLRASS